MSERQLFVVFDPTTDEQLALSRAQVIASNDGSKVHLYACIHEDTAPTGSEEEGVAKQQEILQRAAAPLKAKGIEVSTEVTWQKDWYTAVVEAAKRCNADEVLKSSQRHSKGQRYTGGHNGAEVHFLNGHKDLPSRPDRGTLLRVCGVDSEYVHIRMGDPDDVIVDTAKDLGVNLVVLGNSARNGLAALVKSNTAEKVLDKLECDLLALT